MGDRRTLRLANYSPRSFQVGASREQALYSLERIALIIVRAAPIRNASLRANARLHSETAE
jgi:hypothetical protein